MKLVHLSDLHFGTHDDTLDAQTLAATINEIAPQIVVISGDFTQRAYRAQFEAARDFIGALAAPCFCVPGNHDVPGYDLWKRLTDPFGGYRRYITEDLSPAMETPELVMAGLNSARRALPHWNWANGAISPAQLKRLDSVFDTADPRWSVCVFHHPIHKVEDMSFDTTVFGKNRALAKIHELKIDLVLTGHVHYASFTQKGDADHQTVYLSASTALSWRRRMGQENGFNVISLEDERMDIDIVRWRDGRFTASDHFMHRRGL